MAYCEIAAAAESRLTVQRSVFTCFLRPAGTEDAALKTLEELRAQYRDATHHCFAYMIGPERGIMRYSDAGEPQGTAGLPIMEVLRHEGLTNVIAVVVRYFGGILLGAGGLVRAYAACTADAVKNAQKVKPVVYDTFRLRVSYPAWAKLEPYFVKQGFITSEVQYEDAVNALVSAPKGSGEVGKAVSEASSGSGKCAFLREDVIRIPLKHGIYQ